MSGNNQVSPENVLKTIGVLSVLNMLKSPLHHRLGSGASTFLLFGATFGLHALGEQLGNERSVSTWFNNRFFKTAGNQSDKTAANGNAEKVARGAAEKVVIGGAAVFNAAYDAAFPESSPPKSSGWF